MQPSRLSWKRWRGSSTRAARRRGVRRGALCIRRGSRARVSGPIRRTSRRRRGDRTVLRPEARLQLAWIGSRAIRMERQDLEAEVHGGVVDGLAKLAGLPVEDFSRAFVEITEDRVQ